MTPSPRRIALTGGIACGKSLAGDYLLQRGIPVIDADHVVHDLLRNDEGLKTKIRAEFGMGVFTPEGGVDRPSLGKMVFADPSRRKLLESWIHPETRRMMEQFYQQNANAPLVVAIIPLLFESDLAHLYDEVWLLQTHEELQLERLSQKRGMAHADAQARLNSQMAAAEKLALARQHRCHYLLENNANPEDLYRQIDRRLAELGLNSVG